MYHIFHIYNKILKILLESGNYAACRERFIPAKLGAWFRRYSILPSPLKPKFIESVREALTDDDREFLRTVKKNKLRRLARLFYAMVDGGIVDKIKFHLVKFLVSVRSKIAACYFR